jgi:2-polyprenyl-3-methyl-5-hydroxy-6-metoxy-1,4-benzoquinol methylase
LDPTSLSSHFKFGENWQSFAGQIDDRRILEAEQGLARLVPAGELAGKRFLDIGCGSGLAMLSALRLGAAEVHGIDIDPASVEAARQTLSRYAPRGPWSLETRSILDLDAEAMGTFDIVHSWGVLHHTGAMWDALARSARVVRPGGLLVLALYHKTPFCGLWRREKQFYAHAPGVLQAFARGIFKAAFVAGLAARGRDPRRYIAEYHRNRGMEWHYDVHDWLGGWPYESTLPPEVEAQVAAAGLRLERVFENCAGTVGLFGTGCDEYVARRPPVASVSKPLDVTGDAAQRLG